MPRNIVKPVNLFPVNLFIKRKLAGMTQEELGEKIGLTSYHVLRVEKGYRGISLKSAFKCVDLLGALDFIDPNTNECYTIEKRC